MSKSAMKAGRVSIVAACVVFAVADLILLFVVATGQTHLFFPEHPSRDYDGIGVQPAQKMVDMPLKTLTGEDVSSASLWQQKPVLIMTASMTCPLARKNLDGLARLQKKYGDVVDFRVVYLVEAHPDDAPSPYSDAVWVTDLNRDAGILRPQPSALPDRLELATEFAKLPACDVPVLVDRMDNRFWSWIGRASNVGILVDTDGTVLARTGWFDEDRLDAALRSGRTGDLEAANPN